MTDLKLTRHGTIVALSEPTTGLTVLLSQDDDVVQGDWLAACREHDLPETLLAWNYTENDGWIAWAILTHLPVADREAVPA